MRVIIADDEGNARRFLNDLLSDFENIEVLGEAENGLSALELIRSEKPDLVFLDLEMPELTGFEVVRQLSEEETPLIAFVTAFDDKAVAAFEMNAVDYLLKPVEADRLQKTIARAEERLGKKEERNEAVRGIRRSAGADSEELRMIPVKTGDEIVLVKVEDIASIVADGELLHITTGENDRYLINFRLKDIEARLGTDKFIRLSRGAIVNISSLRSAAPLPGGSYEVELTNGQRIQASRSQSKVLRDQLLKL